jgi:hypothetical protein
MERRTWSCGCASVSAPERGVSTVGFCSRHQAIGAVSTVLANLADAKDLWASLEASAPVDIRELAHTFYFRVQDAAGRARALLDIDRGAPEP